MTTVFRGVSAAAVAVAMLGATPLIAGRAKTTSLRATLAGPPESAVVPDSLGPYPASFSGGYFQLSLTTGRGLMVDFEECELGCTAPFSGTTINVFNDSQPLLNAMSATETLPVGSTISTRFRIRFREADGALWVLRYFGETETCGTDMPTALVNATRTSATDWTFAAPAGSVACLLRLQTVKGHDVETPAGRFRVPFSITAKSVK